MTNPLPKISTTVAPVFSMSATPFSINARHTKTITISYQLTNGTQEGSHSVSQNGTQEMCFGNIGQTTLKAVCNDSEIELSGDVEFTYDYPSNDIKTIYVTQNLPDTGETKTCIKLVHGAQPFCYNQTSYAGGLDFELFEGDNCQSYVESAPTSSIVLITDGNGCNLQGGRIEYESNQTGRIFEYDWIGGENTSSNSRYITFIASSTTWNCSGTCTLEQYGTAHTECAPQELTRNCASVKVSGRNWEVTLPYAATSDLVYKFYAVNGYGNSENINDGLDWEQEVLVDKGKTTGSSRSTQFQFGTSDSYFLSVTASEDSTYNYSDCDIEINSDNNGDSGGDSGDDTPTEPCVNATVKLGSSNTWGDSDLNSQVVHNICPGNCDVSASGNFYYGFGYMGHNHTFDIDFSIEQVGAIIQTIECSTDSGNHSGEGSFGFTYSGINPDLLFQDDGVMTISGTYTFLDGIGNRQTGTYSVTITIIEV